MSVDALLLIIAGRDTDALIEVRCRHPGDGWITAREWFHPADEACKWFIERNAKTLDVYVGVAPRVRREGGRAAIRHSWLLYVDCDTAESAERARRFSPAPTLVVRSGTGDNVHAYWALSHPISPGWFERANRRLAYHLGADVKVTDAARILRPPGTLNHKHDPPVRVTIEHIRHCHTVPVSIVKNFPDPPTKPPAVRPRADIDNGSDPLLGISAERYYSVLTGRDVTRGNVCCPFHGEGTERNPSMRLYETTFYCFACQRGGSIYQFASALWDTGTRGADFKALRVRLHETLGVSDD